MKWTHFLSVALLHTTTSTYALQSPKFSWSLLPPSPNLIWHSCYTNPNPSNLDQQPLYPSSHQTRIPSCARLTLPLDYHNASNPHNVSLAIMKFSPSESNSSKRSTIVMSLGGAGNSRIQEDLPMIENGFLDTLDPEQEYDFLVFDNRGFGYSQPSARCFGSVWEGNVFDERANDLGGVLSTKGRKDNVENGLNARIAAAKAKGRLCGGIVEDKNADIRRYMSTAYAARDILSILQKLETQNEESEPMKLNYIGMSYGTMPGLTFASLYPERVSRMILDGPVNGNDWVGKWQMAHVKDADEVWYTFFTDCFSALESCPLYRAGDTVASDIKKRVDAVLDDLRASPRYTVAVGDARLITYRDVRLAIYWANMVPMIGFPPLARIVDELMRGYTNVTLAPFVSSGPENTGEEDEDVLAASNVDAGAAINCGDEEDISDVSLGEFEKYLKALEGQSKQAGFFQAERRLRCLGWPRSLRPAWRFTGPFTSVSTESNVSVPILFMNNMLDPMTPISNAYEMGKGFPGSVVVEQKARGHCALVDTVPSEGILEVLKSYLRDGILPVSGTVFGEECNMFDGSCPDSDHLSVLSLW